MVQSRLLLDFFFFFFFIHFPELVGSKILEVRKLRE